MKIIKVKVYQFDELSDEAKQKALLEFSDINVMMNDWWELEYEQFKVMGVNPAGFDLDREGYFHFNYLFTAYDVAKYIVENWGEQCDGYKEAKEFKELFEKVCPEEEEDLEQTFSKELQSICLRMLRVQYEYLVSEEGIKETIIANEYWLTEDGSHFTY